MFKQLSHPDAPSDESLKEDNLSQVKSGREKIGKKCKRDAKHGRDSTLLLAWKMEKGMMVTLRN